MCGIILSNNPLSIASQLYAQKNRGTEGAGFISITDKGICKVSKSFNIFLEIANIGMLNSSNLRAVVFHHRFPTSTSNTSLTAHPFKHYHYENLIGIHNGIINNPREVLEAQKIDLKDKWFTGNDSQAVIQEVGNIVNDHIQGKISKKKKSYKIKSIGPAAVVITDSNTGDIYFTKHINPLELVTDKKGNWILSSLASKDLPNEVNLKDNTLYKLELTAKGKYLGVTEIVTIKHGQYTYKPTSVYTSTKSYADYNTPYKNKVARSYFDNIDAYYDSLTYSKTKASKDTSKQLALIKPKKQRKHKSYMEYIDSILLQLPTNIVKELKEWYTDTEIYNPKNTDVLDYISEILLEQSI